MTDYSGLYADTASRMQHVLSEVSLDFSESERSEVSRFLNAREYGLALQTLSYILVEESKPISRDVLREIDHMADAMRLRDERFMYDLHNSFDRQQRM